MQLMESLIDSRSDDAFFFIFEAGEREINRPMRSRDNALIEEEREFN